MNPTRISVLSVEAVRVSVFADADGLPVPLVGGDYTCEFGFNADPSTGPTTWYAGEWDATIIGTYVAQIVVGPSQTAELAAGTWYAWLRVTGGGEIVVRQVGKLIVE